MSGLFKIVNVVENEKEKESQKKMCVCWRDTSLQKRAKKGYELFMIDFDVELEGSVSESRNDRVSPHFSPLFFYNVPH